MATHARNILIAFELLAGLASLSVSAQDFSPFEFGARASGLAGAFTARADDATAVFSNPAGLAFLSGLRFKTNMIFSQPKVTATFTKPGAEYTSSPFQFRGSLALSWQLVKRLNVGLGVFLPYTFENDWLFRWEGRYNNIKAGMGAMFVRPVLSAEIATGLALGIGVDFVFSQLSWEHYQPFRLGNFTLPDEVGIDSRFELSGTGKGLTAGLLWKPHPVFQAGARYVHRVPVDFRGRDTFVVPREEVGWMTVPGLVKPKIALEDLARLFYIDQDFSSRVILPREAAFGVELTPVAALSFYLDAQWDEWSRFGGWQFRAVNSDQDLSPDFTKDLQEFYGVAPDYGLQSAGLVLEDAWKIKAGVEFRPAAHLALRGGFAHHQSPAGDANLNAIDPTPGLNIGSIGFGYEGPVFNVFNNQQVGELSFDVYFRYADSAAGSGTVRGYELTYPSTYRSRRWDFGVGVGINL